MKQEFLNRNRNNLDMFTHFTCAVGKFFFVQGGKEAVPNLNLNISFSITYSFLKWVIC